MDADVAREAYSESTRFLLRYLSQMTVVVVIGVIAVTLIVGFLELETAVAVAAYGVLSAIVGLVHFPAMRGHNARSSQVLASAYGAENPAAKK